MGKDKLAETTKNTKYMKNKRVLNLNTNKDFLMWREPKNFVDLETHLSIPFIFVFLRQDEQDKNNNAVHPVSINSFYDRSPLEMKQHTPTPFKKGNKGFPPLKNLSLLTSLNTTKNTKYTKNKRVTNLNKFFL